MGATDVAKASVVDPTLISAAPAKDFFISMLVRDIELGPSIVDLVDNSVDGALRLHPDKAYAGLTVRVRCSHAEFEIVDNCGGIPPDLARNYAFCFGRKPDTPKLPHSVGQFGVGMKRALFKMGDFFRIETASAEGSYNIEVDVPKWRDEPQWEFRMTDLRDTKPGAPLGTRVLVRRLHDEISKDFSRIQFVNGLMNDLALRHQPAIASDLGIRVNDVPVQARVLTLFESDQIKPGVVRVEAKPDAKRPKVLIRVVAGVSESDPRQAGWYIYCNDRMVIGPDQGSLSGWGDGNIPRFHNQFAAFRGYVFFDSEDAGLLPWRTTKTGIDEESVVFRRARSEMLSLMRTVIDFLNKVADEASVDPDKPLLKTALGQAAQVDAAKVEGKQQPPAFPEPSLAVIRAPTSQLISFYVPIEKARRVRRRLKAHSWREVGERTFTYYDEATGEG